MKPETIARGRLAQKGNVRTMNNLEVTVVCDFQALLCRSGPLSVLSQWEPLTLPRNKIDDGHNSYHSPRRDRGLLPPSWVSHLQLQPENLAHSSPQIPYKLRPVPGKARSKSSWRRQTQLGRDYANFDRGRGVHVCQLRWFETSKGSKCSCSNQASCYEAYSNNSEAGWWLRETQPLPI